MTTATWATLWMLSLWFAWTAREWMSSDSYKELCQNRKKKIEIEKVILRIETFNLLHLKCHFDDQVAFRAQRRGSGGEWHQFIWWRINGWTQQSCRRIIANRRSKSRNHCKKSLWPTRPNPICKIVPFHLISWNYFVCNVVRTREPSR